MSCDVFPFGLQIPLKVLQLVEETLSQPNSRLLDQDELHTLLWTPGISRHQETSYQNYRTVHPMLGMDQNTVPLTNHVFDVSDQFEHGFRSTCGRNDYLSVVVIPVVAHVVDSIVPPHVGYGLGA